HITHQPSQGPHQLATVRAGRSSPAGEPRRAARPPPSPPLSVVAAGAGEPPRPGRESPRSPAARPWGHPTEAPARTLPGARTAPGGSPAVPRWAEFWKESPPLASHRKSRIPGTRVAGIRTPALATAALTSVALLSQTADAAPVDDGKPS